MTYPEKSIFPPVHLVSIKDVFKFWKIEKKRFIDLFSILDESELSKKCETSTCGHTFGEHITCLLIWMEGSLRFFKALKEGRKIDFYDPKIPMLTWTNQKIEAYRFWAYKDIWEKLEKIDLQLQEIINDIGQDLIFQDKKMVWTWLVWTTFGHYDVHSTELEYQLKNKIITGLEKQWLYRQVEVSWQKPEVRGKNSK
ncbi:MAG: hypothetical protein V3S22_00020 [Candidatus Neomarinimicrobiota bacterium]